jgi:SAM-dependent methyltransferase
MKYADLPRFDDDGNNVADPHDRHGFKSFYIETLHAHALRVYVGRRRGVALDVGCGYGRMVSLLRELGFEIYGIEPSLQVLHATPDMSSFAGLCNAAMPHIPFRNATFDLVCLFGVARMVHLLGKADVCKVLPALVRPGGRLVVIDNLRKYDPRYLPETWFDETFARDGLRPILKVPIRASRWPIIYLIRYGLIPRCWFDAIASWELRRMGRKKRVPRFSYYNYLFVYEKP